MFRFVIHHPRVTLGLVVFGYMAIITARQIILNVHLHDQIEALRASKTTLQYQYEQLQARQAYVQSDHYRASAVRQKLQLDYPDGVAIVLP